MYNDNCDYNNIQQFFEFKVDHCNSYYHGGPGPGWLLGVGE
jgi:hypothetical protein